MKTNNKKALNTDGEKLVKKEKNTKTTITTIYLIFSLILPKQKNNIPEKKERCIPDMANK